MVGVCCSRRARTALGIIRNPPTTAATLPFPVAYGGYEGARYYVLCHGVALPNVRPLTGGLPGSAYVGEVLSEEWFGTVAIGDCGI